MDLYKKKMIRKLFKAVGMESREVYLVAKFTDQRTPKIDDMENREANLLIATLQEIKEAKCKKMRAKVAHLLGVYGMQDTEGKLDWDRINKFIVNIGNRNPSRKKLYYLDPKELREVLTQVEIMVNKDIVKEAAK